MTPGTALLFLTLALVPPPRPPQPLRDVPKFKAVFTLRRFDEKTGRVEIEPIMPVTFTGVTETHFGPAKGEVLTCDVVTEKHGEITSGVTGETVNAVGIVLYCDHGLKIEFRQVLFTPTQ